MTNLSTKYEVPEIKGSQVIDRKLFFSAQGHTDLDLWPIDLKINRAHLLVMTNKHIKYEVPKSKRSQVIDRRLFFM
mgnify:CR=1 FL=1